jgi:recombination protein RecR
MARTSYSEPHPFGPSMTRLVEEFAELPGIGRKSAERMANHVLASHRDDARRLAEAILAVKENVRPCQTCGNLTEREQCDICRDTRRDRHVVCVVEQARDVTALEQTGVFHGLYHVLGGRISPLDGMGPEKLNINALVRRVRDGGITEIVMATNPTLEGDGTALFVTNLLEPYDVTVTRLARGIASGSVLEYANKEMLADALRGRQGF